MTLAGAGISVVVPTYRRPEHLRRCLQGLLTQTRRPNEIIVARRTDDQFSRRILEETTSHLVKEVVVNSHGMLGAIDAAVRKAHGALIAFTDDDAVPRPDWLDRMLSLFQDDSVGGVGGRDLIHPSADGAAGFSDDVGRITSWGKLVGNHHLGGGVARDVMVLKGVNMAFRREALALPINLRGAGAQPHSEVAICLWARRQGWRLVYDPQLIVDHYPGPRFDTDHRARPEASAVRDSAYNLVFGLLAVEPRLLWRRAAYGLLVGDRGVPGLVRGFAAVLRGERDILFNVLPSLQGQVQALLSIVRGNRPFGGEVGSQVTRAVRPRILLVAHDMGPIGGSEMACAELIHRGLQQFEFSVLSTTISAELRALVTWHRVPVVKRPFPLKFATFYAIASLRLLRLKADLVHTMGAIVPNSVDVISVHHCHAGFHRRTGRLSPAEAPFLRRLNTGFSRRLAMMAERWSYRPGRTARLAAVSKGVAEELATSYPHVPIEVTPNGVDGDRFTLDWAGRQRFRAAAGAADGDVVVLFVGGDWPLKGLALAIQGLALAQRAVDHRLILWVVGHGDEKRFQGFARASGVGGQVRFFGRRERVEQFYESADLFVLPSLYETFSLVAYEAASCGIPIVATRVSGIEELVGTNEAGILVERTPEAIAAAMRRLAVDPAARLRMGSEGRRTALTFTWQRSADQVIDLYRQLLSPETTFVDRGRPALMEPVEPTNAQW